MEWFKDLDVAWQTTLVVLGVGIIGGSLKWLLRKESRTGVDTEVVKDFFKVLYKALEMIGTDQSKKLLSEIKDVPDEKLIASIELLQDKHNNEQKFQLEKEFQLYGELWKALVDVKSSIIITPTLDRKQKSQSFYDLYNDRYKTAVDAFNKANQLLEYHRPFFHDDVCTITDEFLGQCRGYIRNVARMLKSENFDEDLHDKADELFEIIPKAIDEIEKAIKRRIGLLPKSEIDGDVSISPELRSIAEITIEEPKVSLCIHHSNGRDCCGSFVAFNPSSNHPCDITDIELTSTIPLPKLNLVSLKNHPCRGKVRDIDQKLPLSIPLGRHWVYFRTEEVTELYRGLLPEAVIIQVSFNKSKPEQKTLNKGETHHYS